MTLAKLLPWTWVKKITRIKRSSDAYIFQFDIAGFDPKDIHITVSGMARSTASSPSRTESM